MSDPAAGRLLIVDDEHEIRVLLHTLLSGEGYEVRLAHDGAEAVELLQEEPSDVVISDYLMPEMNGLEFIEATWAFVPRPKVIMLTGYATLEVAMEASRLGIVELVQKPFNAVALLESVARAVAESRREAPSGSAALLGLGQESEEVRARAERLIGSLKKLMAGRPTELPDPLVANDKTIRFGPPGRERLPASVVVVDVVVADDARATAGVFVDDGGAAVRLTVRNALVPDGVDLDLKQIPQGISFVKVHPLSVRFENFLHFRDPAGAIIASLACSLDVRRRAMVPLGPAAACLGVAGGATAEQIERAWADLGRRFDPAEAPEGLRLELAAVLAKAGEARERLRRGR